MDIRNAGASLEVKCNLGYTIDGPSFIYCKKNGLFFKWSEELKGCKGEPTRIHISIKPTHNKLINLWILCKYILCVTFFNIQLMFWTEIDQIYSSCDFELSYTNVYTLCRWEIQLAIPNYIDHVVSGSSKYLKS